MHPDDQKTLYDLVDVAEKLSKKVTDLEQAVEKLEQIANRAVFASLAHNVHFHAFKFVVSTFVIGAGASLKYDHVPPTLAQCEEFRGMLEEKLSDELQVQLEKLEDRNPGVAARLSEFIDRENVG